MPAKSTFSNPRPGLSLTFQVDPSAYARAKAMAKARGERFAVILNELLGIGLAVAEAQAAPAPQRVTGGIANPA